MWILVVECNFIYMWILVVECNFIYMWIQVVECKFVYMWIKVVECNFVYMWIQVVECKFVYMWIQVVECKFVNMYKTIAVNLLQLYCKLNRSRLSNLCFSSAITLRPRIGVAPLVLNLHTSIKKQVCLVTFQKFKTFLFFLITF